MPKKSEFTRIPSSSAHKIAIVGTGRVGLPLALAFAHEGFKVYGVDISKDLVEKVSKGTFPFREDRGQEFLDATLNRTFFPTTDFSVIKSVDYIILVLGTPVDENMNPVYHDIDMALEESSPFFKENQTLILVSSVAPGTTNYVKSKINQIKGLKVGENFFVGYCPERTAEGEAINDFYELPQIIGADDKETRDRCFYLYFHFKVPCHFTDPMSAELGKIFSNMYRYISFAIANEFMVITQSYDRNIFDIVDLVNKGYKRGGMPKPGLTAGPCLYKDGFFLTNGLPYADLITVAWKVNEAIPNFLVRQAIQRIGSLDGKKVAVLGQGFKPEIDDTRDSLALKLKDTLLHNEAVVAVHDPYLKMYSSQDMYNIVKEAEVIFIATQHKPYYSIDLERLRKTVAKNCLICDIWNVFGKGEMFFLARNL